MYFRVLGEASGVGEIHRACLLRFFFGGLLFVFLGFPSPFGVVLGSLPSFSGGTVGLEPSVSWPMAQV